MVGVGLVAGVAGGMGAGVWTALYARLGVQQIVLFGFSSLALGSIGGFAVSFLPGTARERSRRQLRIEIPENLDYTGIFDDIFEEYLSEHELTQVKTTAMGTLFDLRYAITEKDPSREKEMIDRLRERNGNLTISVSTLPDCGEQL